MFEQSLSIAKIEGWVGVEDLTSIEPRAIDNLNYIHTMVKFGGTHNRTGGIEISKVTNKRFKRVAVLLRTRFEKRRVAMRKIMHACPITSMTKLPVRIALACGPRFEYIPVGVPPACGFMGHLEGDGGIFEMS